MSTTQTTSGERRLRAERALATIESHRSDHQRLAIQCPRSHHLAAVYATGDGLVYYARTGPHSHGAKDFVDTGRHGARSGDDYIDLLEVDAMSSDVLPAWCDCGPRSLFRSELERYLDAGLRTVHLA